MSLTTNKTITVHQMLKYVQKNANSQSMFETLPEPLPFVKVTVEVQIGFKLVKVELTEDCLASCNHDKLSNAVRQSEIAMFTAFREFLKDANAHNVAPTS